MLYQLENGCVICLSIEEYLMIPDDEFLSMIRCSSGEAPPPFSTRHVAKTPVKPKPNELDYEPEQDEPDIKGPIDINNLPDTEAE